MNTIYPFLKPIFERWDRWTAGEYITDLEYFYGGQGNEWILKQQENRRNKTLGRHKELRKRFHYDPQVADVLEDNAPRLTLLYALERHITFRQAYGALKSRFLFGDSAFASYQKQISNGGLVQGNFRGILLNGVQFIATQVHPLFYSRGTDYFTHYLLSSLFEVATFPLDTIKTILQVDVAHQYGGSLDVISKVYQSGGLRAFYAGLATKLLFNAGLVFHLRNVYERDALSFVSFPLLAASYALLTLKTRLQISGTSLTFLPSGNHNKLVANLALQKGVAGLYRGLVPFMVLNTFFHYNLYALYSEDAQKTALQDVYEETGKNLQSQKYISMWS